MAADCTAGIRFPTVATDFSLHSVQTGFGTHPVSLPVATGTPSPGVKRPGREADPLLPPNGEVENGGAIPPLPDTSSWRGAYLIKHRDNFILYLSLVRDSARSLIYAH
jgi:hypothetical protein